MMMTPQQREKPQLPNLTLYGIETQLMELLNFRESILDDPDMTPSDQKDSLAAIDQQIAEYIRAEVKKVDGIAGYLREFEAREAAEAEEIERLERRKRMWKTRRENLTKMVIEIMQATKQTRIDGRHSVLQLAKNPPSVEVAQENLVPSEYRRAKVTMPADLFIKLLVSAGPANDARVTAEATINYETDKIKVKTALKSGDGVPGCRLRTDGVRLEVK